MAILTREEYNKLRKQSEKSTSQSGIMTKAEYDKLDKSQLFSGSVLEQYNESITKGTKNTNNKNNNGLLSAFNDGYDFGDITKTLWKGAKQLSGAIDTTRRELMLNPVQTAKTAVVSTAHGVNKASNSINNALSDFSNWIMGRDKKYHLSFDELNKLQRTGTTEEKQNVLNKYLQEYGENSSEYQLANQILNTEDTRSNFVKTVDNVVDKKYYDTDTYKNYSNGNMAPGQKNIWNIGENIGNMLPSMAVSTVTGVPVLGSAVFFTQAQQNYTEEAKTRGYEDKDARTYGLIMGGLESLVERLGFDQLGGLKKMSQGNLLKSMVGEGLEEFVMPYIDSTIKSAGYNEKFDLQGTTEEAIKSAVSGAIVGGIMNLGGQGFQQVDSLVNKINNNGNVTSDDILGAVEEIQKTNPKYFDEIIEELPKVLDDKTITEIQEKTNQKEVVDKKILPTVEEIVAQEKNTNEIKMPIANKTVDNSSNLEQKTLDREFLTNYDQRTAQLLNMNERNIIVKNYKQLDLLIDEALTTQSNNALHFGKINENIITRIKKKIQNLPKGKENYLSKNDYDLVINQSEIRHLRDNKTRLTNEEIHNYVRKLPEIITESDSISYTVNNKSEGLRFKKVMDDGTYISFVLVSNKKGTLTAKSIFLDKQDFETKKRSISPTNDVLMTSNKTSETDGALASYVNNDTIKPSKSQIAPLPNTSNTQNNQDNSINVPPVENNTNESKVLNPLEISNLKQKSANTTPTLPDRTYNKNNDGNSHFFENIRTKTNMLNENQKNVILNDDDVKYYDKITNKVTLEKAFDRLNENGAIETKNWFAKDSEKATAVDVAEGWILLKQYADKNDADGMVAVAKKLRDMGTKAGQTVQAFNIMERMSPEGMVKYAQSELSEAYDKMVKNKSREWIEKYRDDFDLKPEEVSFIMKTMEEVQQMEDGYEKRVKLAEIQQVMIDKLPPERGAGIKAWMRISMLFNPKTQVRNFFGNAVIAPVNYFSDLFSGIVDKAISKKTGVRTIGKTDLKSYLKGFKTGLYQSYNDYKKGINTRNIQGNRFEIGQGKSFNDNTKLGKLLNRLDSLLSFMLDAGDRGFYEASFTNSINNQLVLNNTTEVTQEMNDIASTEALSRTWQDNNGYTKFVLQTRTALNKINVKGYGLGDVLIPFAKTPANLTKAIVDYSPAGLVKTIIDGNNLKKSLSNGQYNAQLQHQFVQELGKATAGTMLYVLGYALAKAGVVNGESDDDKDTRDFMKNTLGVSSYSIKIGNKSFTYDWAQPISAPLSIMANYVRKSEKNKDASKLENLISSLDVAGNILLQQSFMESINTVLSNNDGLATGIQEAIMELPSRAIPTLMKQIVDLTDSTQRQTFEYDQPLKTAINKVKAKVPILSKTLSPSVDTMGREIQKYGGKNNIFNVLINPANVNTENISNSAKEIYRLYKSTGETNIMPRVAPYYINQSGEKITLNATQRTEYQKISGSIIETSIADLLKNTKYKNMDDTEKAEIINKIVNYSYNKAREDILDIYMNNEYNKINMYIADGGKVSDYYLNKEEVDYSYSYPEKYKTIKQITTYDKYLDYQDKIDNVKDNYDNTNQRKTAVINYVNSLKLSIPQKAMLIKLNYSSYDTYNKQIIEYIVNQKLTATEKSEILTKLGFTVKDGRVYY